MALDKLEPYCVDQVTWLTTLQLSLLDMVMPRWVSLEPTDQAALLQFSSRACGDCVSRSFFQKLPKQQPGCCVDFLLAALRRSKLPPPPGAQGSGLSWEPILEELKGAVIRNWDRMSPQEKAHIPKQLSEFKPGESDSDLELSSPKSWRTAWREAGTRR